MPGLRARLGALFHKEPAAAPEPAPLPHAPEARAAANANGNGSAAWGTTWPGWGGTSAENVATLCACIDVIASAVASLPPIVYETLPSGERREAPGHPVARLLAQPNALQSWPDLVKFVMGSVLLAGNALLEIRRDGNGQPTALAPILWSNAQPILVPAPPGRAVGPPAPDARLAFDVLRTAAPWGAAGAWGGGPGTGSPRRLFADNGEVFFLRERSTSGVLGTSRLQRAPLVLAQALAVQQFATCLWDNVGTPNLALSHPGRLGAEAVGNLAQSYRDHMAGPANARRLLILEEGLTATPLSASAEDSQVLESRRFAAEEIARIFGVPAQLVGITTAANFANSQQAGIWFGQHTLKPWALAIEAEFARSVFADPARFCLSLDLSGLVRGDFASQVAAGISLVRAGCLTQNELRAELGYNPLPGGDQLVMQSVGGRPPGQDGQGDAPPAANGGARPNGAAAQ